MSASQTATGRGKATRHLDIVLFRFITAISTIGMPVRAEFGVAQAGVDGYTVSLLTAVKDGYDNHLNFAFTLDAEGNNVYFASTQGTAYGSTLNIEKHDGTEASRGS